MFGTLLFQAYSLIFKLHSYFLLILTLNSSEPFLSARWLSVKVQVLALPSRLERRQSLRWMPKQQEKAKSPVKCQRQMGGNWMLMWLKIQTVHLTFITLLRSRGSTSSLSDLGVNKFPTAPSM